MLREYEKQRYSQYPMSPTLSNARNNTASLDDFPNVAKSQQPF